MMTTTFKQEALDFTPKMTLNIADLDAVDLNFPIEERTGTDKDGKDFSYKVMIVNAQEYRVPNTVFEEVKKILELKPEVQKVKVTKTGSGLQTRYQVKVIQ